MTSIGVLAETAAGENRVAIDPAVAAKLVTDGIPVVVEAGAGLRASFDDAAYVAAGATVASRAEVIARSEVVAVVRGVDAALASSLRSGQLLIGLLDPLSDSATMQSLATAGVTAVAFELLPRTVSRAQSMDALSSQASAAGYRAAIVAAAEFDRYLPMMITASGTAKPASVIVLGAGVAGLQAIGTAKRLGAVVTGYDVRPSSRTEVESVGGRFLTSSVAEGAGAGGYARALTPEEQVAQQEELSARLVGFDIIITTAKVPGRTPPLLVTDDTLAAMRRGSVCIDLAASDRGGNVAGSVDGERIVTAGGVVVIGAGNLASDLAAASSEMYARNVLAAVTSLTRDGAIAVDPDDEVHAGIVVCHDGEITSAPVRAALGLPPLIPSTVAELATS
jgi:NAD(P) transhydrogenase subunit alpha